MSVHLKSWCSSWLEIKDWNKVQLNMQIWTQNTFNERNIDIMTIFSWSVPSYNNRPGPWYDSSLFVHDVRATTSSHVKFSREDAPQYYLFIVFKLFYWNALWVKTSLTVAKSLDNN